MTSLDQQLEIAERLSRITQRVGFALWQLQELEGAIAHLFVLLVQAEKGMGLEAGNQLIDNAQAKTFGNNLHRATKAGLLSTELETRLTNILAERNWLVHKSRSGSRSTIYSDAPMQTLINRLDSIANESHALLKELAVLIEDFVRMHGVSQQYLAKQSRIILEQWHSFD